VIARRSGLGSAETLRRTFAREVGATPHAYRRRFLTTASERSPPDPQGTSGGT